MKGSAKFSEDRSYRYVLGRNWSDCEIPASITYIMLNPSTASATKNDPTIHQCMKFAAREEYDAIWVVNLFAWRSPQPSVLREVPDPVGPENDKWILWAVKQSPRIVLAWGNNGKYFPERIRQVRKLLKHRRPLHSLGTTGAGFPRHPARLSLLTPMETYAIPK